MTTIQPQEHAKQPENHNDRANTDGHKEPPTSFFGTLKHIGPGLILAGGCVGSGELIATTSTGGKAGMSLLWLIIFGCVIKVLVQIEFGRYTIFSGRGTMAALNLVPGPSVPDCCSSPDEENGEEKPPHRGKWIIWVWFFLLITCVFILQAGIISGVGQALAMCLPITAAGSRYNHYTDHHTKWIIDDARWPDNRTSIQTYVNMQTLWQQQSFSSTLDKGERRFLQICHQTADNKNHVVKKKCDINSENVSELIQGIGGPRLARDAGADIYTKNATDFFVSLGTWPSAADDDLLWSLATIALTSAVLAGGRYGFIQHFSTILVLSFTGVSIANLIMLQTDPVWRLTWSDILYGLSFHFSPPEDDGLSRGDNESSNSYAALAMAMATFGIIGVSPSQIIQYPYWCMEKGYAKYTGRRPAKNNSQNIKLQKLNSTPAAAPTGSGVKLHTIRAVKNDESFDMVYALPTKVQNKTDASSAAVNSDDNDDEQQNWVRRARGWIAVLYWDAWLAMVFYTFTTVAFYFMGAAILYRTGLEPRGTQMIRYLAVMYEPAFGVAARVVFIIGAIAVLYSTHFIETAGAARMLQDALVQVGVWREPPNEAARQKRVRLLSAALPWLPFVLIVTRSDPRALVLFGGFVASAFLPLLALAALYFYFVCIDDDRIKPRPSIRWLWNILLCLSAALICASGVYACWVTVAS